ncbi:MAG: sigma-70 family RNA polymerase sigma factor [Rhizobiales bacterium]|nr:sigma-70 family RNA polymerase sigma factor [Hyphomicrobiales bacterium]
MVRRGLPRRIETADIIVPTKDDHALFDDVFLPHLQEAYRLARWLTGNANDAEDVVQEAALRAFRAIAASDVVNPRAWSLTIVRNTAYSWLMKNKPKDVVFAEELNDADRRRLDDDPQGRTPEDVVILNATADEVHKALAALPALFREVVVLREMHELSYRDIAAVTNLPIGTVMSRLARARQMLIGTLGQARP